MTVFASAPPAAALELTGYAALLARHTRAVADAAGTRVDYAALRGDPDWRRLVGTLAAADPESLATRDERLAFWINAYNVLAIDWIVRRGPARSIRDLGSIFRPVWKKPAGAIAGRDVTLDGIEHGILRPMGEPRIHFAIVCASTSCPSLRREPFGADDLDRQLDDAARRFLSDPRKGMALDRGREDLRLSRIFQWFAEDFGGASGVVAFAVRYGPERDGAWLAEHADEVDLTYFDYDWSLNGLEPGR